MQTNEKPEEKYYRNRFASFSCHQISFSLTAFVLPLVTRARGVMFDRPVESTLLVYRGNLTATVRALTSF